MTSIAEVAALAGVSTATVSRTLNGTGPVSEITRIRVLLAAEQLGYVASSAASTLASGRTQNVGVMMPFLDRWYFSTVLTSISSTLMQYGYDVTLYQIPTDPNLRRQVFNSFIRRGRIDALISVSLEFSDFETSRLLEIGLPTVIVGGEHPDFDSLDVDHDELARVATKHLIDLGHERIAYIGGASNGTTDAGKSDFELSRRRLHGFLETMQAAKLSTNPDHILSGDFTIVGGYLAAKQLLALPGPRPTALFAANDEMALGAMLAANESGIEVPDDLSVIGIDGHELGEFFNLTTVDINPREHGAYAVRMILNQIGIDTVEESQTPAHKLVRRETTQTLLRGPQPKRAVNY